MGDLQEELLDEIIKIADTGVLPDGDHVNLSTQMWAEEWVNKIEKMDNNG